jgi:hypothetical protein
MRRCGREEELYDGALEINGACREIPNSIFFCELSQFIQIQLAIRVFFVVFVFTPVRNFDMSIL